LRILNKYLGILTVLVFIVLVSGCISFEDDGNNYSAYGVSFNYPEGWYVTSDNETGSNMIFVSNGSSFNPTELQIQIVPNNGLSEKDALNQIKTSESPQGYQHISNTTLTINGKTAYQDNYIGHDPNSNVTMKISTIYFVKNENMYLILIQAPEKVFDQEKQNFEVIINSLKVQ